MGVCKGVVLQLQGMKIQQDFFRFSLGGADIVLGMDWLASLGEIRANFKKLTIKLEAESEMMILRG